MTKRRPAKTLADYAVIAINPALIMLLVGSLAFFLLEATYDGRFEGRLKWLLFWFVFASVLIARIAIQMGSEYASLYGLALAAATSLVIFRFIDAPLVALLLLGVVWWCANKITWDCTLIDDSQDASGEGLLRRAGLQREQGQAEGETARRAEGEIQERRGQPSGELLTVNGQRSPKNRSEQPHAPGLWIVYFSLLALPLFGLGQLLIPASDEAGRAYAFRLLWVYVAAALALLLTTSFLGLRRYLRQRRLRMPAPMAATWLGTGAVLIAVVLFACLLLPRPDAKQSLTAMLDKLAEKQQRASRYAVLGGEGAEDEGRRIGDEGRDSKDQRENGTADGGDGTSQRQGSGNARRENDQERSEKNDQGDGSSRQGSGSAQGDGKGEGQGKERGKAGGKREQNNQDDGAQEGDQMQGEQQVADGDRQPESSDRRSWSMSTIVAWAAKAAKWIIYAVITGVVLWALIKNRAQLLESLRLFWHRLMSLFGRSPGERKHGSAQQTDEQGPFLRPFASFDNPFLTGAAGRMKADALVVYTFEALEAWAGEHGYQRGLEQTPMEFVRLLGGQFPEMSDELRHLGRLYARVAYDDFVPSRDEAGRLEPLWRNLSAAAPRPAVASIS